MYDECRYGFVMNCFSVYFDLERNIFGWDLDCCFVIKMRGIIGKVSVNCDISSWLFIVWCSCLMFDCFVEVCFYDFCLLGILLFGSD